jgi:hypothetical protein
VESVKMRSEACKLLYLHTTLFQVNLLRRKSEIFSYVFPIVPHVFAMHKFAYDTQTLALHLWHDDIDSGSLHPMSAFRKYVKR